MFSIVAATDVNTGSPYVRIEFGESFEDTFTHVRLLVTMNGEQYFARTPRTDSEEASRRELSLEVDGRVLRLQTDRGVFSRQELDAGTKVLLDAVPVPPAAGDLLDLGCGWGPIAATMAVRAPAATVWAVDVNERALTLTRTNAARNGITNIRAMLPEEVPDTVRFGMIWSNPPVRIGKEPLRRLLTHWLGRLAPAGEAWLVINRNLGADSLAVWLAAEGYRVDRLTSKRGFRVLRVRPLTPAVDRPES
jgi:16S rRNA G1207 methylase RsmC